MNYRKSFSDHLMTEQSDYIDHVFQEKCQTVANNRNITIDRLDVTIETNSDVFSQTDIEFRMLLIDDKLAGLAFIRRNDWNHMELALTTYDID